MKLVELDEANRGTIHSMFSLIMELGQYGPRKIESTDQYQPQKAEGLLFEIYRNSFDKWFRLINWYRLGEWRGCQAWGWAEQASSLLISSLSARGCVTNHLLKCTDAGTFWLERSAVCYLLTWHSKEKESPLSLWQKLRVETRGTRVLIKLDRRVVSQLR